ncbi:MAG: toll/interleukin-1 receptor domain-containing protein [Cyanobacteria bacterium P01_H01_bin.21]
MSVSNAIFISYRRSDSNDVTGRIYDFLSQHFDADVVFKDVDSIPLGIDFRTHLNQTVGRCQVLVAVMGPTWLKVIQERLNQSDVDWVRAEIETALERGIPVVPLLVGGADMPSADALPEGLEDVAYRNATLARPDPDFKHDMGRLIQGLEAIVGVPTGSESTSSAESVAPSATPAQSLTISGGQLSNVQIGGLAGRDLTVNQSQQIGESTAEKSLTPADIANLLDQLKSVLQASNLPDNDKAKAIRSVETAQDEVQADEPDKEFAAKNLQRVTKVLKDVGETVDAGTGLWQKVKPILEAMSPWLNVGANFFLI